MHPLIIRGKAIVGRLCTKRFAYGFLCLVAICVVGLYYAIFVRLGNRHLGHQNQLRIPDLYTGDMVDGRRQFRLVVDESQTQFLPGKATSTAGVNGSYLGPTLRVRRGDNVDFIVENRLDEITTMHWHGMHVPAKMDGTPHQTIEPGKTWTASFPIDQQAATMWYHPHPHGNTGRQIYSGIAGQLWIDDENSESLDLPNEYGVNDIPLIIQDRIFDDESEFRFQLRRGAVYGDTMLINGTVSPFVSVETDEIRFRLLNGSNARIYHLGFDDERTFRQIATDGGFLEKPVPIRRLALAPGERAEILVDFSDGKAAMLKSFPDAGLMQTFESFFDGAGSGHYQLLDIRPLESSETKTQSPRKIETLNDIVRFDPDQAVRTRMMALGGPVNRNVGNNAANQTQGPGERGDNRLGFQQRLPINGKVMDMHRVDERVRLGDAEIWELTNRTGQPHPFHVHLVQFQIVDRNGQAPTGAELGWKDTVLVHPGDEIRVMMEFKKYADPQTPYMYHCHITEHEDNGMMGQFLVVEEPKEMILLKRGPTVFVFVLSLECDHCYQQVQLFDETLSQQEIGLVVITPEGVPDEKRRSQLSCEVISDTAKSWAGWFGLLHEGPAHGTLIVDGDGKIQWSSTDETPFMDVDEIVRRVKSLHAALEPK